MKTQQGYLEDILERIKRIEKVAAYGKADFLKNVMYQDAIIRNFEVIGEVVKRLDPTLLDTHTEVAWKLIAGFRDVLIHDYEEVRLPIVWTTIQDDLPTLKSAVEEMLATFPKDTE